MKTSQLLMVALTGMVLAMAFPQSADAECRNTRSNGMDKMPEMGKRAEMPQCCRRMNHAGHTEGNAEPEASSSQSPLQEPTAAAAETAGQQPRRVEDPVCSMAVDPKTAGKSVYKGKTYYFCSQEHKAAFDAAPERYLKEGKSR